MSDSIKQYTQRPKAYANADGTGELGFGLSLLGLALVGFAQTALPKDSIWQHGFYSVIFMSLVFIPFGCLGYFGSKAVKKYITYPRTGYVAYLRPKGFSWLRVALYLVVVGAIAAGIATAFVVARRDSAAVPLRLGMAGVSAAAYCSFALVIAGAQRWKWFVYGLLALGLVVVFLATSGDVMDAAQRGMLLAACTYLASGVASFCFYMRQTQVPGGLDE